MDFDVLSYIITIIQMAVLGVLIFFVVRKLKDEGSSVILGFCLYAFICLLLMDLYWLASSVLKPELRIPYGAGDIADSGVFLLFSAMLGVIYRKEKTVFGLETLLVLVFSLAIISFWIGWSDEWFKNIIGGIAFGFFLWQTVMAVKKSKALKKSEAVVLGLLSYALLILMSISFMVEEETVDMLNNISYVVMILGDILLVAKSIQYLIKTLKDKTAANAEKTLAVSFTTIVWILNASYMCDEPFYSIEDFLYTCMLSVMMISLIMVVDTNETERLLPVR